MYRIFILCFFSFVSFTLSAQSPDDLLEDAKALSEKGQYEEALDLVNGLIEQDSLNSEAYQVRGNILLDMEETEQAVESYLKALSINPEYANAAYNAGLAYELLEDLENAKTYFAKYVYLEPEDVDGLMRLAYAKAQLGESATDLYEEILELDEDNVGALYFLAMDRLKKADYEASLELIERGKTLAPEQPFFAMASGFNHYEMKEFALASKDFAHVLSIQPLDADALLWKTKVDLLQNTDTTLWNMTEGQISFTAANGNTMVAWVDAATKAGTHDKEQIVSLMEAGEPLSIDQYLYYYASHKDDPAFSPYGFGNQLGTLIREEKYDEVVEIGKSKLREGYVKLDDVYRIALAHYNLENTVEFQKFYTLYLGLMQSLLTLGDGLTAETAYFVMTTSDEYALMSYMGMRSSQQSLVSENGHSYDILSGGTEEEGKFAFYFNIDVPFGSLGRSLTSGDEEETTETTPKTKKQLKKEAKARKKKEKAEKRKQRKEQKSKNADNQ